MSNFDLYMRSIQHWRARFLAVGVPAVVFDGIVGGLKTWSDWPVAWEAAGHEEARYAEEELARGHALTAGACFQRAALYYHFGQFVLFYDEDVRARLATLKEQAYEQALPLLRPSGTKVRVPTPDGDLYGILRRPLGASGNTPVVIMLPGADSTKEEYFGFEDLLLTRGLATFGVDGPGQGETKQKGYRWRFDYEEAFPAVLSYLQQAQGLDRERIGLLGFSFGAYLAPRVAARCPQIKAAVSLGGCFDLSYWDELPPLLKEDIGYIIGGRDAAEARELALQHISLAPVLPRIQGNLCIVHSTEDRIFQWQDAHKMAELAPRSTVQIYEGADHVCHNVAHHSRSFVGDWLADQLAPNRH